MTNRGGIYHYVPHAQREQWEALGWVYANDLGLPHNQYAVLYKWAGEGKPIMPYLSEERDKELADFDYVWPDPAGGDGE